MNLVKYLNESLENIEDIDEANMTANMDGGEGPVKTPSAFKKSNGTDPELEPDDAGEVFDYKKAKKEKPHFESLFKKLAGSMFYLNETPSWSVDQQKMVNQIKRAQREGVSIFKLPMKTQAFYKKYKDAFKK